MDWIFSHSCEISISKTENIPKLIEYSLTGDSSRDSKGCSSQGELLCSEAPQGTTSRIHAYMRPVRLPLVGGGGHLSPGSPSAENLDVLAEKVGTLDLKTIKKEP